MGLNFSTLSESKYLKSPVFQCIQEKIKAIILVQNLDPFRSFPRKSGLIRPRIYPVDHFFLLGPVLSYAAELSAGWQHWSADHRHGKTMSKTSSAAPRHSNVITPIRSASQPLSRYFSPVMYYLISLLLHM
jgi:hypothetical protein